MKTLPQTGTAAFLEVLSPHFDDAYLNDLFPTKRGRGRRPLFQPNQLFRVLLLSLLTPAHSFNLLSALLAENRAWREFAFLPNKRILPDAKMLHQFRDQLDCIKLRAVNRHLLNPLLEARSSSRKSLAIIDSTDLPAATRRFKKKTKPVIRRKKRPSAPERLRAVRVVGLSVIRSTRCACGWRSIRRPCCSCHW
jgi:hypothetical protein